MAGRASDSCGRGDELRVRGSVARLYAKLLDDFTVYRFSWMFAWLDMPSRGKPQTRLDVIDQQDMVAIHE